MAFHKRANYIFFPGLLVITVLSLPLISSENVDCNGKAFHCVNSTHFKICVDLGGGVSKTVDEFLIPCPRSTVCNDVNRFECEYQVTTTLPSVQQSDVTTVWVELDTTSSWVNVDVTTLPGNYSNDTRAITTDTSYLLNTNDTINDTPSTTFDVTWNQENSIGAINVQYNETSVLSESAVVTNTDDVPTVNEKVTLNDYILNSTVNTNVTFIRDESSLSKTIQGALNIETSRLNVNDEKGYMANVGSLSYPSSDITVNPISFSTETLAVLNDINISTTPEIIINNSNIQNVATVPSSDLLKATFTTDLYTENPIKSKGEESFTITTVSYDPLTTVSNDFTNMKLTVRETTSSSDNLKNDVTLPVVSEVNLTTENTLRDSSTNIYNAWKGLTGNMDEQNNTNTSYSSYTDLTSTILEESSTVAFNYADFDKSTRDNNDFKTIATSPIYTTDLYSVGELQNNLAEIIKVDKNNDVINVLNLTGSYPVTPIADIVLSEVTHNANMANYESVTKDLLESNTHSNIEISKVTEENLISSNLEVPKNYGNFPVISNITQISNSNNMYFTNMPEINVTIDNLNEDVTKGLSIDDKLYEYINNTFNNATNIGSVDVINNHSLINTSFDTDNSSSVASFLANFNNTTPTVPDTVFTFVTNPTLINTSPSNFNFSSSSMTNTQYTSTPENNEPTTIVNDNIYFTEIVTETTFLSDLNVDINNGIFTDNPQTATLKIFDKDLDLNKSTQSYFSVNENITVSLKDTTNNLNNDILTHQNEKGNDSYHKNKNETHENITNSEKANGLMSSSTTSYDRLHIQSLDLITLVDPISAYQGTTPLNNKTNLEVPNITNNDILNTTNESNQSSFNQTMTETNLNTTQRKEEYEINNLSLALVNSAVSDNLINLQDVPTLATAKVTLNTNQNKTGDEKTNLLVSTTGNFINLQEVPTLPTQNFITLKSNTSGDVKNNQLVSIIEAIKIPDSFNLRSTSYEKPTEAYDSVTPHILGAINPYINLNESLTIIKTSRNMSDHQNVTNSKLLVNDKYADSGSVLSTTNNTLENVSNTQELKASNSEIVHSDSIISSSPLVMQLTSATFNNNFNVESTIDLPSIPKNIAQTTARLLILEKKYNYITSSTTSNVNQEINHTALEYNENIIVRETLLGIPNNGIRFENQNENKANAQVESNLTTSSKSNVHLSNIVKTEPTPTSTVKSNSIQLINGVIHVGSQMTSPLKQFSCAGRDRGKYSDEMNCNKFHICVGKPEPIIGMCPEDTVFSEIRKQCTNNLSHCIRNNQFKCISSGRFVDVLSEVFYYICVKKEDGYVRFKLQCQKGYHLNKESIQCSTDTVSIENNSNSTSDKGTNEIKSEDTSHSANYERQFECEKEGKFEHPDDCRKYFVCRKNSKSKFRRRVKKCSSDEVFNKEKRKCVDADSYEC